MYRKYILQKEMCEGFGRQSDEDVSDVMSDFCDYIKIIGDE